MSDDGAKGTGDNPADEQGPRPETAAGRRARRRAGGDSAKEPATVGAAKGGKGSGAGSPAKRKDASGPATRRDGEEKSSIPKRIARYLREVVAELRKVIWPTRKQMVTYTIVVLAFVAFMVALVWVLDWVFGKAVFGLFG
ncbi:MAG: preprotein translocase subunit SecE [Thermocrispum sp.]